MWIIYSNRAPNNRCFPDGIVECDCCAARCLEIKCPWTFRGLTIAEFAAEKETYLIPHGTDFIVDPSHQYYAQIQCQMAVTGSLSCDFFVCTVKEYHLSRVAFDQIFWQKCIAKIKCFYDQLMIEQINNIVRKNNEHLLDDNIDFNITSL